MTDETFARRHRPPANPEGRISMLGRKTYTTEELDHATTGVDAQLAAYRKLVKALQDSGSDPKVTSALGALESVYFNNMTIALDRYFIHRLRIVAGKDSNPLNEVELLADSLMNNDGVLRASTVVKLVPADTVLKLDIGDRIRLDAAQFERLAKAFFAEIERRFVAGAA
jgi:hypothetical protein